MNDLICFSHLRWDFVYQRPQHLMTRFARVARVFYFEEPVYNQMPDHLDISHDPENQVFVVKPNLTDISRETTDVRLKKMLDELLTTKNIRQFVCWYYSPMALAFSDHLHPVAVVYDCMDELSAFKNPPPDLIRFEKDLLKKADVVFTGGYRLFEAKKSFHRNIYPFPSSIDKEFFAAARSAMAEPEDQQQIKHPRLGFFGVIDERFDIELVRELAGLKPDWQFVFIGPVVKIDAELLPKNDNIHYLGMKDYKVLPEYISGWDICIMPFAMNESTEFISPTKTPEFLAAGKRVISTPIHDVVNPYGTNGLVSIAKTAQQFAELADFAMKENNYNEWLLEVDEFLSNISWDKTWNSMEVIVEKAISENLKSSHQISTEKTSV